MSESNLSGNNFPDRLRAARELRGLSQSQLAKLSKLQASAVSHFETNTRKPSFANLRRLADALDVTTDYLLGRVDDAAALAGPDTLHRHFELLTTEDRAFAEEMLKRLAEKNSK
jgi:transcriptional regulator with XRE-family HTH domain